MKVQSTKDAHAHELKILIYGESGAGKTSLAKTIDEPTLVISAEGGLLPLRDKAIDFIDLSRDDAGNLVKKELRIERLQKVYQFLLTEDARKKYKWIFIDSLSELSQNLTEALYLEYPEKRDSLNLYGELAKRSRSLVKSFRDLPYYNVVFTALSEIDKDENGRRFNQIQMTGKIANQLPAYFDEVFYLQVQKDENGNDKRILITNKTDQTIAKDRSSSLSKIEEPNLSLIAKKIRGQNGTMEKDKKLELQGEQSRKGEIDKKKS